MEPGQTASMVFTLARETGWPEQYILWQLPLHRALAYQHAALCAHGVWTVTPSAPAEHDLAAILTQLPSNDDED
jgi:hypothetical protein